MNDKMLEQIYEYVRQHFGLARGDLPGRLASMEKLGLLLSEDGGGRLYPYEEKLQ